MLCLSQSDVWEPTKTSSPPDKRTISEPAHLVRRFNRMVIASRNHAILRAMTITERNRFRAEAGLPLLDVVAEAKRLSAVAEQAAFEQEWQRRRSEFAHQWVSAHDGWFSRMAKYASARQQVRRSMETASPEQ